MIRRQVPAAAKLVVLHLEHGERAGGIEVLFDEGGFTAEQVLRDWFPGAADGVAHQAHR
jgi:hypothetical protein